MEKVSQTNELESLSMREEEEEDFYDSLVDGEKIRGVLKSIEDESVQLNEYLSKEKALTREICDLLRKIIRYLGVSIEVSSSHFSSEDRLDRVFLNKEGNLSLVYGEGRVVSKTLEECNPSLVVLIIYEVLPKLQNVILRQEHKVQKRISIFEKVKSELKSIFKNLTPTKATRMFSFGKIDYRLGDA